MSNKFEELLGKLENVERPRRESTRDGQHIQKIPSDRLRRETCADCKQYDFMPYFCGQCDKFFCAKWE